MAPLIPESTGKWLVGVPPEAPLSSAAALAISSRLAFVSACLPLAAHAFSKDPEFVHQLRVGSRRAAAAMTAFDACLPIRRARKTLRLLKKIRRAAGVARDLDVLLLRLAKAQTPLAPGEMDDVNRYLNDCRADAQQPLISIAEKNPPDRMERKLARLVRGIRWRGRSAEPTVCQAGRDRMGHVATAFCAAASAATVDRSMEALHQLRIAGKRLRYTIELFACVAEDDCLRQGVYPLVEELQGRLGAINDHVVAQRYLQAGAEAASAPQLAHIFQRLASGELRAAGQSVEEFERWWNVRRLEEIEEGTRNAFPPPSAA